MKLSELLAAFLKGVADLKAQANATLAGLPILEQHEGAEQIGYGIRALQRYANELVETASNLESKVAGFVTQATEAMTAEATAKAEEVLLSAGEWIKKVDATAAQGLALAEKEKELRETFTAELAKEKTIKEKRSLLVSNKTLPLVVAEALSGDLLAGEKADEEIGKVNARLKKLTDLGLTADGAPKVFAEVAGIPLTTEGDTLFEARLGTIAEARGTAKPAVKGNPLAGAGAAGSAGSLLF